MSKLKLAAALAAALFASCACNGAGNKGQCLESVKREFPGAAIITKATHNRYEFLVCTQNGELWLASTFSPFGPEVTESKQIGGVTCSVSD